MTSPIRVLLVDDHTLFRSGVRALLARQAEIDVVGEAENGPEGVKLAASLNPDVVLLDLNMPGLSGVETLQLLLQDAPQRAVVMLTVSEDADDLAGASPAPAVSEADKLTPREREILVFIARGDSNKEIARTLDLAESTVKIHVQNILKKLNLSSRVQAAVFAVEHGLADSRP